VAVTGVITTHADPSHTYDREAAIARETVFTVIALVEVSLFTTVNTLPAVVTVGV